VQVAADREDFVAKVKCLVDTPALLDERRRISDAVRGETWAAKVDEILGLVSGKLGSGERDAGGQGL
jgi:hypothetical protein